MTFSHRRKFDSWVRLPWYVILLAVYPVLALAAVNVSQIRLGVVVRPLMLSLLASLVLWGSLYLYFKDWSRAAFLASLLILLFYAYGHVYQVLRNISPHLGRGRYLVPLWGCLSVLSFLWAKHKSLPLPRLVPTFNLIAVSLTLLSLGQIGQFYWQQSQGRRQLLAESSPAGTGPTEKPDIYYLILDSYGRTDTLQAFYEVDNTAFLQALTDMGFVIAPCSQSNYAQTPFSIASALNLNYLTTLGIENNSQRNAALLVTLSRHSLVRQVLEANGYRVISFASGFVWSEWPDADKYLEPPLQGHISEFEALLIRSSFGLALLDVGVIHTNAESANSFRQRTLYVLETLPEVATWEGPKFVFVHLIVPHPPFVFGPNGEERDYGFQTLESQYSSAQYRQGYREQVEFINQRILPVLKQIIASSPQSPVIILQGDHGPGFSSWSDRMKILNAYYLPAGRQLVYPSISPVNSFRLVLNTYFGSTYPILDDHSYFSSYNTPYDFQEIENDCSPMPATP